MGNKRKWELLLKVRHGHKFYAEVVEPGVRTGRIGIADESGRYPEDTDDGVLIYDSSRDVVLASDLRTFSIPVAKEAEPHELERSTYWTGEEIEVLFDVAAVLGITHVVPGSKAGVFAKWVAVKVNDQLIQASLEQGAGRREGFGPKRAR